MKFGVSLPDYDEMTPAQLNMLVESRVEMIEQENDYKLQLAYMTAYWHRVETLKPYNEEVKKEVEEKVDENKMSDFDMLLKVHELNSLMGGSVE